MTKEEKRIAGQMKKRFNLHFCELESVQAGRLIFLDEDLKSYYFKDWNEVESFLETSKQN